MIYRSIILAAAISLLAVGTVSAVQVADSRSNIRHQGIAVAPTPTDTAACTKAGGTYSKHGDGLWYCNAPASKTAPGGH